MLFNVCDARGLWCDVVRVCCCAVVFCLVVFVRVRVCLFKCVCVVVCAVSCGVVMCCMFCVRLLVNVFVWFVCGFACVVVLCVCVVLLRLVRAWCMRAVFV